MRREDRVVYSIILKQPWVDLLLMDDFEFARYASLRIVNMPMEPGPELIGRRVALHAAMRIDRRLLRRLPSSSGLSGRAEDYVRNAYLGSVRVVGIASSTQFVVAPNPLHDPADPVQWIVDEPVRCEPIYEPQPVGVMGLSSVEFLPRMELLRCGVLGL
jgi:hypothetical protein